MKKQYTKPQLKEIVSSNEDIMNGSDVEIDVSDLFGEE